MTDRVLDRFLWTRELALQIFGVLQRISRHHSFSCGLLIGGNDLAEEVGGLMNIRIIILHYQARSPFVCGAVTWARSPSGVAPHDHIQDRNP